MLTRSEIMGMYDVDSATGIIMSPGKFEQEMLYVPALYEYVLDGSAETVDWPDDGMVDFVEVCDSDREEFPEIPAYVRYIGFEVSDSGFVTCSLFSREEYNRHHLDCEQAWDDVADEESEEAE